MPIKVDREERPDIDRIYMLFVQATTGGGGWPMSVWLTPELKPFFGGTYFPPDNRYGRPGFPVVLERIARGVEGGSRPKIEEPSARDHGAIARVRPQASPGDAGPCRQRRLDTAFQRFRRIVRSAAGRVRRRAEVSAAQSCTISCCVIGRGPGMRRRSRWC